MCDYLDTIKNMMDNVCNCLDVINTLDNDFCHDCDIFEDYDDDGHECEYNKIGWKRFNKLQEEAENLREELEFMQLTEGE